MKRIIAFAAVLALLFALTGCKTTREDLKFYVVPGALVTRDMDDHTLFDLAKSEGRLAFTGADIAGWLWEDQRVQLQNVYVLGGAGDGGSALFQADAEDCFVLAIGNRVIYAGGFAAGSGSVKASRNPYIQDGEDDTFYLLCDEKYQEGEDPRASTVLYDYLAEQQLLVSTIQSKDD